MQLGHADHGTGGEVVCLGPSETRDMASLGKTRHVLFIASRMAACLGDDVFVYVYLHLLID